MRPDHSAIPTAVRMVELGGVRTLSVGAAAQGRHAARRYSQSIARKSARSPTSRSRCCRISRRRRSSRWRTRGSDRDARGAGAADRDRRGVAGHQFLARRPRAGVRRDARKGACGCASAELGHLDVCDGETVFRAVATRGVPSSIRRVGCGNGSRLRDHTGSGALIARATRSSTSPMWRNEPIPTTSRCAGRDSTASARSLCVPLRKDERCSA